MKEIIITSRKWNEETSTLEEHRLTILVSNTTAKSMLNDFEKSPFCSFTSNSENGISDFSIDIRDKETGVYEFQAVRM